MPLFEGELTRDEVLKLVARYPLGCGVHQIRRGNHWYWSARTPLDGGRGGKDVYIGSEEKKLRVERAWQLVRAELAEAEAKAAAPLLKIAADARAATESVPEIRHLHELRERIGVRKVVDIPIQKVGGETRPPK